jgi:hypothetical protein
MSLSSLKNPLTYRLVGEQISPAIDVGMPGTAHNRYGFEGGRTYRLDGVYHWFTAEMVGDPHWVKMQLAHWRSADGDRWERVSTLFESSGDFTGQDSRAALWAPMPIFDESQDHWVLFYVAYHCKPNTPDAWYVNHAGRIWCAVSQTPGRAGIGGPYPEGHIVLQPDAASQAWEGLQGVDSFHPHRAADGRWLGFYGSAQTQNMPCTFWGVGLASASDLTGPWRRCPEGNPVKIDPIFAENPVVDRIGKYWIAMVDGGPRDMFGYTISGDGYRWSEVTWIDLKAQLGPAWQAPHMRMRTPLGLIAEDDGTYSIFFTFSRHGAGDTRDFCALGRARLRFSELT